MGLFFLRTRPYLALLSPLVSYVEGAVCFLLNVTQKLDIDNRYLESYEARIVCFCWSAECGEGNCSQGHNRKNSWFVQLYCNWRFDKTRYEAGFSFGTPLE